LDERQIREGAEPAILYPVPFPIVEEYLFVSSQTQSPGSGSSGPGELKPPTGAILQYS
jgi:hypothetical protein